VSPFREAREMLQALSILRRGGLVPAFSELPRVVSVRRRAGAHNQARVLATRFTAKTAIVDEKGHLTYDEFADTVDRLANSLNDLCPDPGQRTVALMCRNSRYVAVGFFAGMAAGARLIFLNTDMGPRQVADVCERERVDVLFHDEEFGPLVDTSGVRVRRYVAWRDATPMAQSLDGLVHEAPSTLPPKSSRRPEMVILTSGSTGSPKGAPRKSGGARQVLIAAGFLEKIPIRPTDVVFVGPPAFHGWGLLAMSLALSMGATVVLPGRFRADRAVDLVVEEKCTVIAAVPTMLQRMIAQPGDQLDRIPRGQVRIIGSGGARLDPGLVLAVHRRFGPVLHNFYGATEASFITIATPEELEEDPTTAGRPPIGHAVRILSNGQDVPAGTVGDIYVKTPSQISAYTDGREKETVEGFLKTGDTGSLDTNGRLRVHGRTDGMIVSGGENVFPEEVEMVIRRHPAVQDTIVTAIDDPDFGQRLLAIVEPAGDPVFNAEELNTFIATHLSRSRIPKRYVLVDDLARTATGKVARATLEEILEKDGETMKQS